MTDITHEIAFGCVNIQLPREAVWERTAAGFQKMDITHYVFDEPSANLDSGAVMAFHAVLSELKNEGKIIIVLEHRVFYLSDLLDRMIVLKDGVIQDDFNQSEALALSGCALKQIRLRNFNLDTLLCAPRTEDFKMNQTKTKKLNARDWIVIGVLAAIKLLIFFVIGGDCGNDARRNRCERAHHGFLHVNRLYTAGFQNTEKRGPF